MEFIKQNWSEIILIAGVIIGGIRYLIKTYFDLSIKKTEIIFDKVKEQKLKELKNFFLCYNNLDSSLNFYSSIISQNDKKFASHIEKKLGKDWANFQLSILYLKLFLSDNEIKILSNLEKELIQANKTLRYYGFDDPGSFEGEEYDLRVKKLREIRNTTFKKTLPSIIEELQDNLRKDFRVN